MRILMRKIGYGHYRQFTTADNPFAVLVCDTLKQHGFTDKQCREIVATLEPFLDRGQLHHTIDRSLAGWKRYVLPKKGNSETVMDTFRQVFYDGEPRLLLLEEKFVANRLEQIGSLDLVRGVNDIWRVFHLAPVGYFIQDWNEFLKKYYYVTHRILPVLYGAKNSAAGMQSTAKGGGQSATHPLVQCPAVMEQPYQNIKTRFIFVQRTAGFRSATDSRRNQLHDLLLTDEQKFLRWFAPNCTAEELAALKRLHGTAAGEEDDQLFDDLVRLSAKSPSQSAATGRRFLEDSLDQGLILSGCS